MKTFSLLALDAAVKTVAPTDTELDRFQTTDDASIYVVIENRDGSQTCNGWIETRPKPGVGNWARSALTVLDGIAAGEVRNEPVEIAGAGEVRIMATASGAGLTAWVSRRNVWNG